MGDPTTTIAGATELERLAARSRLIGSDPTLVIRGGGNTSSKLIERDHLGRERTVLRIKASGADLATAGPEDFTGVYLDELLPLRERAEMSDEELAAHLARCIVDPGSRRPSIETLLHAFLPAAHVDHVHADAICVLTNNPFAERVVGEALGPEVAIIPYLRSGFDLSLRVAEVADRGGAVLVHHGLVTWGETHEESYGRMLALVQRARAYLDTLERRPQQAGGVGEELDRDGREALIAAYRGRLSRTSRRVLHIDGSQRPHAERPDAATLAAAGRATPDHVLSIGIRTLHVGREESIEDAVDRFEAAYGAFFDRHRDRIPPELSMLDPLPKVALVAGVGCIAAAPDAATACARAQVADHTHSVGADVLDLFGEISWLDESSLADIEYWPLELYKLTLEPPAPELAGMIAIVTGAGSGIGREIALDLAERGAHVVLGDVDAEGLSETTSCARRSSPSAAWMRWSRMRG
jgi:rhamnose utilization protein RhaD (predicted bifunctional aldolase and dehydrogenase)